jgi:adenylate cyclase
MGTDEAGTLAALKRHREAIFDPAVAAHKGRIVKLIGDGVIAEFGSVIDAVSCALSVQRSSATTPEQSASQPIIVLRGSIVHIDVFVIGGIHQGVAAFHHPWPTRQRLQNKKASS